MPGFQSELSFSNCADFSAVIGWSWAFRAKHWEIFCKSALRLYVCVVKLYSIRVLPHKQNSGGFFVAVLHKKCSSQDVRDMSKSKAATSQLTVVDRDSTQLPSEISVSESSTQLASDNIVQSGTSVFIVGWTVLRNKREVLPELLWSSSNSLTVQWLWGLSSWLSTARCHVDRQFDA